MRYILPVFILLFASCQGAVRTPEVQLEVLGIPEQPGIKSAELLLFNTKMKSTIYVETGSIQSDDQGVKYVATIRDVYDLRKPMGLILMSEYMNTEETMDQFEGQVWLHMLRDPVTHIQNGVIALQFEEFESHSCPCDQMLIMNFKSRVGN